MKCSRCGHQNLLEAKFCEKCGEKILLATKKRTSESKYEIFFDHESEISDNIYDKEGFNWVNAFKVAFAFLGIIFLLLIVITVYNDDSTNPSTQITPIPVSNEIPLSLVDIENIDSHWVGEIYFVTGTVVNKSSTPIKEVRVRADFYRNENDTGLFDTRYFSVKNIAAKGAYSFEESLPLNAPVEKWWYRLTVDEVEEE